MLKKQGIMETKFVIVMLMSLIFSAVSLGDVTDTDAYDWLKFDCDGETTGFTYDFRALQASDLVVIHYDTDTDTATTLTNVTDYTVSVTNNDFRNATGGTVTTVSTYGATIDLIISTQFTMTQLAQMTYRWRPATVEDALDKSRLIDRQLYRYMLRSLRGPEEDNPNIGMEFGNAATRKGYWLGFDSTTGAAFAGTPAATGISVSSFMATMNDDADAATARTTLELGTELGWHDVRAYGADPTGATDSTTAIQAAIDAANSAGGGIVFFPIGTYKVSSTLFLKPSVSLIGASMRESTIDYVGTGHVFSAENDRVSYFTIQDLTIDGNGNTGDLINITNADSSYNTYIILKNLRLISAGENGIRFSHVLLSQIENCNIWYCGDNGIYLDTQPYPMTSISINDIWIHNLDSGHGIYVAGAEGIHSLNLGAIYTELIVGDGIHIAVPSDVVQISIDGFVAEAITGNGIKATTSYMTVKHALFTTISEDAIHMVAGGSLTAINCRFHLVTGDDFDTGGASVTILGCEPQDNIVFDAGTGSMRPPFNDWNVLAVTDKTSDYTILKSDHFRTFTNTGAGGAVNFTLPTLEANLVGFEITIMRGTRDQILSITPEASDFINPQRLGGGVAIHNISDQQGDSITLKAVSVSGWQVVSQIGIWGKAPGTQGDFPSFADVDATPDISSSDVWLTGTAEETITDFDQGYTGQVLTIISKAAVTFDTTTAQDADHNLDGSSVDIVTATGDVTQWICEDGTTWRLIGFVDASADNSSGA